jgi:hypothetical protein
MAANRMDDPALMSDAWPGTPPGVIGTARAPSTPTAAERQGCGSGPRRSATRRLWFLRIGVARLRDGDSVEPQLRYRRVVLLEEAAAADQKASWLDGYLLRGDALDSESLARLFGELEPLPAGTK